MPKKVQAIMDIAEPCTRRKLRSFLGIVNYYRDMWIRRSHVLAPLASLTSTNAKRNWGEPQKKAFAMAKRIIAREVLLAYPDFSKSFQIHTDASHYLLGAVISQDGKPIAFYSRKLKPASGKCLGCFIRRAMFALCGEIKHNPGMFSSSHGFLILNKKITTTRMKTSCAHITSGEPRNF
jgi:RNase H-like domain found in reverse transcriptase